MPRAQDISICLVGFESHKAHPDLGGDSGFWLRVDAKDAAPFIAAFKDSPDVYHEFMVEQRLGKEIRASTLCAQILEIKEGPETRVLIRPHLSFGALTESFLIIERIQQADVFGQMRQLYGKAMGLVGTATQRYCTVLVSISRCNRNCCGTRIFAPR